jgi:glutaredoxin
MFTIITTPNCPWCDKAKDLLREHTLFFVEVPLKGQAWLKELMARANMKTVPQIFRPDGQWIGGFKELETYVGKSNDPWSNP